MFIFNKIGTFYHPQRSWGKVICLHLSVILFTGGGSGTPAPLGRHSSGQTPPWAVHAGIRSTSGRYASYWNAFLFLLYWSLESLAAHGTSAQPDDFIAPSLTPTKYYYALSTTHSPASLPLSSPQSPVPTSSSVITADSAVITAVRHEEEEPVETGVAHQVFQSNWGKKYLRFTIVTN